MQTQAQVLTTMDYILFALISLLCLQCTKEFRIYLFKGVMKGRIRAISRHMEGQESSESDPHQGKLQKNLDFCTHPDVRGFRGKTRVYM